MAVMTELERQAACIPGWDWSCCAVIARQWDTLDAIRCYCEWRNIPAQYAREESINFWRLRETQMLLDWLKPEKILNAARLNEYVLRQTTTPGWAMLREAITEYHLETIDCELPSDYFREWLYEWGREARRKQNGLLLVTAHRAKGLEFDHVAVLDGHWQADRNEDADSVRRLYYVAMTRARKTLVLARFDTGNLLLDTLPDHHCLLRRSASMIETSDARLDRQYMLPALRQIDIGYASRYESSHKVHGSISRLTHGSPLSLEFMHEHWFLLDEQGQKAGKMANAFTPPRGMHCVEARVNAIIVRRKEDDTDAKYGVPKCERWEVVMPELVFAKNL